MSDDEESVGKAIVKGALSGAWKGAFAGGATTGPAGIIPGAGLGVLAGGGASAIEALVSGLKGTGADRLDDAIIAEAAAAVEEVESELIANLEARVAEGGQAHIAGNAAATANAWWKAWRSTPDDKKRRLLMAALVNAFDKDTYEEGLAMRLLSIVSELDYGELYLLKVLVERPQKLLDLMPKDYVAGGIIGYHLTRLEEQRLVRFGNLFGMLAQANQGNPRAWESVHPTSLGTRLAALLKDLPQAS